MPSSHSNHPVPQHLRLPRADVVVPWLVGGLVFIFRLSSVRGLTNDHYMHLSWAQQVLLGMLPGRDFVDPGMPLAWGASALGQALAPGPFSEAVLSTAMFGITAALTCWVVTRLTGGQIAGAVAALTGAALVPRLYNYPKLLVPALTLYLLQRHLEHQSHWRRIALALGVAAAVLFRHDLGLYASIVVATTIMVANRRSVRSGLRELVLVGGATTLALAPYLVYVEWSEGLIEHLRRGIEFSKGESHQLGYEWPVFPSLAPGNPAWSQEDAVALLCYVAWLLPLVSLLGFRAAARTNERDRFPLALASTLFLALYLPIVLRYPLDQRLPDIATPLVVVGAFAGVWALRASLRTVRGAHYSHVTRVLAGGAGVVALGALAILVFNVGYLRGFADTFEETGIERGPLGVVSRIRAVHEGAAEWPWTKYWPNSGEFPPAVLYLRSCTTSHDYLLLTWSSPEYYFFTQRRFAAGHSMFLPPRAFTTERDQEFMIARLTKEQPPIALVNKTRAEEFRRSYPMVDDYIRERYTQAASFRHYDNDEIAIEIRNDLRSTSMFGSEGWPCGLVRSGSPSP